jgi:hypothetical protein
VSAVAVQGDKVMARLEPASDPKIAEPDTVTLDVRLEDLRVGATDLTAADFVGLARGRLRLAGAMVDLEALKNRLVGLSLSKWSAEEAEFWKKAANDLRGWDAYLRRLDAQSAELMGDVADGWAKAWLGSSAFSKGDVTKALLDLAQKTTDVSIDLASWDPTRAALERVEVEATVRADIDASVGMSTETWFFTYVTPTVGYAATSSSFGVPMTGLQLYFFPNSAAEPMWINGVADFRRLVSIEAGVSPSVGDFGPDNRISGPASLPPLYAGLGIQLIPYTVASGGVMVVDIRKSTLEAEIPQVTPVAYFALSVQANVPDIVASLVSGNVATTDTNKE